MCFEGRDSYCLSIFSYSNAFEVAKYDLSGMSNLFAIYYFNLFHCVCSCVRVEIAYQW